MIPLGEAGIKEARQIVSFYIGGMGSRQRNFHKELMARMGFEAEAEGSHHLAYEKVVLSPATARALGYEVSGDESSVKVLRTALQADDTSARALAPYDEALRQSYVREDLYRTRNMRLAFKSGFYAGGVKAGLMSLTRGAIPGKTWTWWWPGDPWRSGWKQVGWPCLAKNW